MTSMPRIEVIHQWQSIEKVHPELLGPSSAFARKIGLGYWVSPPHGHRESLAFIKMLSILKKKIPLEGLPKIDEEWDGIYATRFSSRILYYNSTATTKIKRVAMDNFSKRLKFKLQLQPHSIAAVDLASRAKG